MSQEQVLEFLSKNKNKWFSSKAISKGIKLKHENTITNLARLRNTNFVLWKQIDSDYKDYRYKINFKI